jgi:hypothetical protein
LIDAIEEYEDKILANKAKKRLEEMDENDLIDFDEAIRLARCHHDDDDKEE